MFDNHVVIRELVTFCQVETVQNAFHTFGVQHNLNIVPGETRARGD